MTDSPDDLPASSPEHLGTDDIYLELMISTALGHSLDASFTLSVMAGGSIVSGDAISYARWRSAWIDQLEQGGSFNLGGLREDFEQERQAAIELEARLKESNRQAPSPRFVHIMNAAIWAGSAQHHVEYWRGPIRGLNGWWIGTPVTP